MDRSNMDGKDNCLAEEHSQREPRPRRPNQRDLKRYIKSLGELTLKASNDAISYETFSPDLKKRMSSFKAIFGNFEFNSNCYEAMFVYQKLLRTVQKYDAKNVYDVYVNWSDMLPSFTTAIRAETFIANVETFKPIVKNLENAGNRWSQLNVLSILILYTQDVNYQAIKASYPAHSSEFFDVIHKIVLLPRDQELALRANNALLSSINSKNGSVLTFQPYKISCRGEKYILTDYELWMDCNVTTKVISFMAVSVTTDKSKNLCGVTAPIQLKILSRQQDLYVRGKWCLSSKTNPGYHKLTVEFCFSDRINNEILRSNLKNVFEIVLDRKTISRKTNSPSEVVSHSRPEAVDPQTGTQISINELKIDELEKPTDSTLSAENRIDHLTELTINDPDPVCHELNNIEETIESQTNLSVKTTDYFAQSSLCHEKIVNDSTKDRQRIKKYLKRRVDSEVECSSSDTWNRKRIRMIPSEKPSLFSSISSEVPKFEPAATMPDKIATRPSIGIDEVNQNDGRHIHNLAEVILMAADHVIRTLRHSQLKDENVVENAEPVRNDGSVDNKIDAIKLEREQISETQKCVDTTNIPQDAISKTFEFDRTVYEKNWMLRRFLRKLQAEPDYGSEIEMSDVRSTVDEGYVDVHYGSISNP